MKRLLIVLILFTITFATSGYTKPDVYKIDAEKNASYHNNMGTRYVDEENYPAAIKEFNFAIALNPHSQATAVYYNNLGDTYMKVMLYSWAQNCYEKAIALYPLNFTYYQNLAICYKMQGIINSKINYYTKSKSPLNMVMLGLLYIEKGDLEHGVIKLDEFCMQEPDLIITGAVRNYLQEITQGR